MIFCVKVYTQTRHYDRIFCMKQFKKRTIALVLASVVTVAGSFAAGNYKNTLMGLDFIRGADNSVDMILQTKEAYNQVVSPVRKNANTYIITLPEVFNQAKTPDLLSVKGVASVNFEQLPYTNNTKGYTKITVSMLEPSMNLTTRNEVYLPSSTTGQQALTTSAEENKGVDVGYNQGNSQVQPTYVHTETANDDVEDVDYADNTEEEEITDETASASQPAVTQEFEQQTAPNVGDNSSSSSQSNEAFLLVMAAFLVFVTIIFFYIKAKNKLAEIAGEQIKINVDDDDNKKKKKDNKAKPVKKTTKIRAAIKNLDTKYPASPQTFKTSEYSQSSAEESNEPAQKEQLNVVDLDELFQEKKREMETVPTDVEPEASEGDEEENQALEDFLSGFSFEDEVEGEVEEEPLYNEELYNKIIEDGKLRFTADDAEMINKLLRMEINDDTMRNIKEYAVSNPIKKEPSKREILEDFVTTYAVSQNITFTREDIDALNKIISVEIDKDFLSDLKTNPQRARELEEELEEKKSRPHKSSEVLTLNVKDLLPDLSQALRKQGGRKIESEVKPVTIYYSEGYDVSTIALRNQLPDLSVEINNEEAYKSKPSAEIKLAETGYEVEKLNISEQLPDLEDVMAHPEKYADPEPEEVTVDEEALLKNITNVQFKPIYDENKDEENLNEFDEKNTPTVSDIQKEFSQFANFEISEEDFVDDVPMEDDYDDFEALYRNDFVDLDNLEKNKSDDDKILDEVVVENAKPQTVSNYQPTTQKPQPIPAPKPVEKPIQKEDSKPVVEQKTQTVTPKPSVIEKINSERRDAMHLEFKSHRKPISEELQRKIEQTRAEREARKADLALQKAKAQVTREITKCICDGKTYAVISVAAFDEYKGCYLVKNDSGYAVLGYVGDKLIELKQYATLKSEKIQARNSEKLADGALRYLVRIGLQKLIVDVKDSDIKYVMDLC